MEKWRTFQWDKNQARVTDVNQQSICNKAAFSEDTHAERSSTAANTSHIKLGLLTFESGFVAQLTNVGLISAVDPFANT